MFAELFDSVVGQGWLNGLRAAAEIAILAYVIYQLIRVLRGSRAVLIGFAILFLTATYYLAGFLGFTVIEALLGSLAPYVGVGIIVIFHTEIRAVLRSLAERFTPQGRSGRTTHYQYEDVVFAVSQLAQSKVGALIVIERDSGLKTFVQSGVPLDARLSSDLLVSIFQRSSPLHDGGVIIQESRIAAAACFLPLTTNPQLVSTLGTRHRAAIGLAEESDAMVLVVSETDGRISIALGGNIERGVSTDRLRLKMIEALGPVVSPPKSESRPLEPSPEAAP